MTQTHPTEARNVESEITQIIAALEARASFYDLLAPLYFKPLTAEQIENFDNLNLSAYEAINPLLADGANDLRRYLKKRNSGTRQELAVDFTGCFGGTSTWEGRYAVPYESVFTSEEGLLYQDSYHEVHALFLENGVKRAAGFDYPDDHLSFMFEYLVVLSERAAQNLRDGAFDTALQQVNMSTAFIRDHILSWFDDFEGVASKLIATRFYRGILKITRGFLLFDVDLLTEIESTLATKARKAAER